MRKTKTKTSLSVTMNPEGGASILMKWSDLDVNTKSEASERIIVEMLKIPDYKWLAPLIKPYLIKKYCKRCCYHFDKNKCSRLPNEKPFPYCFVLAGGSK